MAETKARHIANLVEDDGDVKSAHLDNTTSATPTAVSDQANTSTGYFDLPSGTTAQRPGSPNAGNLRFNTDEESLEFYSGTAWAKTNEPTPLISSISGNIYVGTATNLTITGSDFNTNNVSIQWLESNVEIVKVDNITPTSATSITTAVPSQVYGQTAGDTITLKVLNAGTTASGNSSGITVTALPTGGTITQVGSSPTCYVHTFTTGANFCNTISNLSVCYLVVAGGGGGGRYGGGGGAGGLLSNTTTLATGTTAVVIGNGASENTNGGCSSWNSIVTCGGGTGGWYARGGGTATGNGCNGGSGGGATFCYNSSSGLGGTGISGQGCDGATNITWANVTAHASGGGGGRGGNGSKESSDCGGDGGAGIQNSINGTGYYWAGGGGGGTWEAQAGYCGGEGGIGGGGAGRNTSTSDHGSNGGSALCSTNTGCGAPNTGGGGGGGCATAGQGGSGIVILRYCLP